MKITLDIDCYDEEDFEVFKSCLKEREEILKLMNKFKKGKLTEFELVSGMHLRNKPTIYLTNEILEENKDFVKKALELMLETNKRDTESLIERLGIEYYEGVEE
jgi:hypothetical protein